MPTALQQVKSANGAGITSLVVNITSSLSGSVLWVFTAAASNGAVTLNLPTDSGSETYVNLAAEFNLSNAVFARMDDVRNSASGVTSVTAHVNVSCELSVTVQELTGTNNTLDSTVPALTNGNTNVTTGAPSSITTATGSILAAGITDNGGTNTADTVSPAAYVIDGLTPNGTNERVASATAANAASGAHQPTFTFPSAIWISGQAAYQAASGAQAVPQVTVPLDRRGGWASGWRM